MTKVVVQGIQKVESRPGKKWARVTVKDHDGRTRVIAVRKGSIFPARPKPQNASA